MDYWYWIAPGWRSSDRPAAADVVKIEERAFAPIDRVVELGRKHGLHVCLNFHRPPGYCINGSELEPFALWRDQAAEDAPRQGFMTREDYRRVMTRAAEKIREITPDRLIIIDGLSVGNRWSTR